jgi:hypothetical protein
MHRGDHASKEISRQFNAAYLLYASIELPVFEQIISRYSELLHSLLLLPVRNPYMAPPVHVFSYTWTALGCRPKIALQVVHPLLIRHLQVCVFCRGHHFGET